MSPPFAAGPSGSIAVTRSAPLATFATSVSPIPVCGGILARAPSGPQRVESPAAVDEFKCDDTAVINSVIEYGGKTY